MGRRDISQNAAYKHGTVVLRAKWAREARLWEWLASEAIEAGGDLIIDDTTWQRCGTKLEAASFVWDSTLGKRVFGMQVVLLLWTNGRRRIPLG